MSLGPNMDASLLKLPYELLVEIIVILYRDLYAPPALIRKPTETFEDFRDGLLMYGRRPAYLKTALQTDRLYRDFVQQFKNLRLVCKAICAASTPFLFQNLRILRFDRLQTQRLAVLSSSKSVAPCIRSFHINPIVVLEPLGWTTSHSIWLYLDPYINYTRYVYELSCLCREGIYPSTQTRHQTRHWDEQRNILWPNRTGFLSHASRALEYFSKHTTQTLGSQLLQSPYITAINALRDLVDLDVHFLPYYGRHEGVECEVIRRSLAIGFGRYLAECPESLCNVQLADLTFADLDLFMHALQEKCSRRSREEYPRRNTGIKRLCLLLCADSCSKDRPRWYQKLHKSKQVAQGDSMSALLRFVPSLESLEIRHHESGPGFIMQCANTFPLLPELDPSIALPRLQCLILWCLQIPLQSLRRLTIGDTEHQKSKTHSANPRLLVCLGRLHITGTASNAATDICATGRQAMWCPPVWEQILDELRTSDVSPISPGGWASGWKGMGYPRWLMLRFHHLSSGYGPYSPLEEDMYARILDLQKKLAYNRPAGWQEPKLKRMRRYFRSHICCDHHLTSSLDCECRAARAAK